MRLTRLLVPKMKVFCGGVGARETILSAESAMGVIINIGGIAGIESMSGAAAAFSASKHALVGWTRAIYSALRHDNIKVMLVNPAFVNTPMISTGPFKDQVIYENMIQPEDVASVCLLPFHVSAGCVPAEVTLRLALSATK